MTALQAEGLVGDLLEAVGVTREGSLDSAFLSDTGRTLKGVLHDARRRGRLLAFAQGVLTQAGLDLGPAQSIDGRDWLPVIGPELGSRTPGPDGASDHLDLSVVLDHTAPERTVVGLGIRYTHDAPTDRPRIAVHAVVPLVAVPITGAAALAPGTPLGDVRLDASLEPGTESGAVNVEALRAVLLVPTDGVRPPHVVVTAEGLQLGDADPVDVKLDTADPLVDQALHVGATLLRGLAESADPRLGALLRMIGMGADDAVPPLPLADLAATGRAAIWSWLRSLATPAALRGWADALADLLSQHAVVDGDATPQRPIRVRLPLGPAALEVALLLSAAADGSPVLTLRVSVDVDSPAAGVVPRLLGRAEADVVTVRLAALPTATAVPGLRLFGRAGPDAPRGGAPALVQQAAPVAVALGSVTAGLALDPDRHVVPLLAAHEVVVGTGARRVERERVDLTDAQALADLGAATLDTLVDQALAALGAGDEVRAALSLLGLRDPHGRGGAGEPAWPHRVNLADLLADPLGAVAASVAGVVAASDVPVLLGEVARLLPRAGAAAAVLASPIPGTGTRADPWRVALDDDPAADVELTCTAVPGAAGAPHRLTFGLRAAPSAIAVPGVGVLTLAVEAALCTLTLPTAAGAGTRPAAELAADLAVRARLEGPADGAGGHAPLLLGDVALGVRADALTAGLRWTPAAGLRVTGSANGLVLDVGGLELPLELPAIDRATGQLVAPDPPWPALEALAGYALRSAGSPVLRALGDLLGWGRGDGTDDPGVPAHLALEDLVADPVAALLGWLRSLAGDGDAAVVLSPLLAWLSALLGDLLEDEDPADGALRGTGTPTDPWALRLRPAGASVPAAAAGETRSAELLLWCEPEGPDVPPGSDLTGIALPSWLELGVGENGEPPAPADLAALLTDAATILSGLGDVVRGRSDLATSLAALRDRLAGGDGLLPAAGAAPARWTATTLAGVDHAGLQAEWADAALDPAAALFVTGPLGDPRWWPLFDPARLVDLTAPGLPAAAFDLAAIDGPGPWFVALPARAAARVDPTAPGDGFDDLVARLRAAVDTARVHAGGPLTVVAHSTAGLPARLLAATAAAGVGRLVTLGTPLDGATVGFADLRPTADAVHALRALWLAAGLGPGSADLPEDFAPGARLVGTLDALLRADPLPPAEFAAPTAWPSEAASVTRESVTGTLDAADIVNGLVQAVRAALYGGLSALGAVPPLLPPVDGDPNAAPPDDGAGGETAKEAPAGRPPVTALATGVRHDLPSAPDERGIAVTVRTTITGPRLGAQAHGEGEEAPVLPGLRPPAVEFRVVLRRQDGWLVGGPLPETGVPPATRPPRLRWAELVLGSELRPGGQAGVTIVLHEAAALGMERVAWPLRLTGDGAATLPAEARVLLFRLASALGTTDDSGPMPATGAARALAEVLRALGIATLDEAGHVGLVAEAVERFLVAPGTALRESVGGGADGAPRRRELARALRVLAGVAMPEDVAPATATGTPPPARVDVTVDGLRLLLDLDPLASGAAATLDVAAELSPAGALALSASCRLELVDGGPRVSGSAHLGIGAAQSGLPYLALDLRADAAPALTVGLDVPADVPAGWFPRRLPLWPPAAPPEETVPGLLQLALATAPAALAQLGGDALRSALDGTPAGAALDGVLRALGLLGEAGADGAAHVRLPLQLVLDPAGWLRNALDLTAPGGAAGRAAVALVEGARTLAGLGTTATPAGHLPLPYGLDLVVAGDPATGGLTATLGTAVPMAAAGAAVELAAGVRIAFDPASGIRAQSRLVAGVSLWPAGAPAALASLRLVAEDAVRLDLVLPGPPERTLPLVPAGPGLGDLVGEAAVRLLPTVLDAVVAEAGDFGDVVAGMGDALGLRSDAGAGRRFDGSALAALADDPAAALLARVRDHVGDVVTALGGLADMVLGPLPAGVAAVTPSADGSRLAVVVAGRVTLTLARSGSGTGLRLDVAADVPVRVDGTTFGTVRGDVGVDQRGLALVAGGASLGGDLLAVLGVPLRPWLDVRYAPSERTPAGAETPASRPTLRAGLILPDAPGGPAGPGELRAVVATVALGQDLAIGVVDGTGAPVTGDPGLAIARVLVPLLLGIGTEAVQDLLDTRVGAGPSTVGEVLDGVILRRVGAGAGARWAPAPDVLDPDGIFGRVVALAGNLLEAFAPTLTVGPLTVTGDASVAGGAVTIGVRLGVAAGETWWLVDAGDVRVGIEVATEWLGLAAEDGGLELSLTVDPAQAVPVRGVTVAVRGATVRVAGRAGEDLLDATVRLRSVALSAAFLPTAPALFGGRLVLDRLAVPLGGAGGAGGNGVASKVLDADSTGGGAAGSGDTEKPAPALSPELSLVSRAGGPVAVDLRMGDGDGPWWLPLQAHLGPVYIEQFGFGVTRSGGTVTRLRLLVDGGVSIAGLAAQVDDLELNLPWPAPWEVSQWRLDLAGLAVGYEGSGVSIAGGLLKSAGAAPGDPPSYLGMVVVNAASFGINAFGGFGVYPVPGSSDTYVSFFVVAALHAPLGGPPAFFVTGVGGGIGINRALVLPTDVAALPRFPLVQALDPSSTIASEPMGALHRMGQVFPPQRSAVWFAAGVSFTSFSLVEGVALVSVSVGDGVEIALMGLARLGLPNPRVPIAQIELALIARFSTRDMVLWIQAQLTDNSWVISQDARLTGGFAFVTWFRTGDFVVTLGGYHPNFRVPHYPQVPRLGLSWTLGQFLSIRGETYFALCSTAVMVGSRIDVSFRAGPAYARVVAGFDAIVRFDPLHFEIDVYASVTGGIRIEIDLGWFGSIVIDLSISIGARLHVEGPEVHGTATLQMGPVEVPFRFGPQAPPERTPLSWPAFFDKYLRPGGGQVLTVSVAGGAAATPGEPAQSRNDGSDPGAPWPVLPEFDLTAATTLAARSYAGAAVPGVGGLGIGPMDVAALASDWRVTVRAAGVAGAAGDRTARLAATPRTAGLPPAVWRALPSGQASPALASGVDLVRACTGVDLRARAQLIDGAGAATFDPFEVEQDRARRKPLPFAAERDARPAVRPAAGQAVRADVGTVLQSELAGTVVAWLAAGPDVVRVTAGRGGPRPEALAAAHAADGGEAERVRLLRRRVRGWQAVPRPVRITEGLGPRLERPVPLTGRPAPMPDAGVDARVGWPAVLALLDMGVTAGHAGGRTTVTKLRGEGAEGGAALPRRAAPPTDPGKTADRAVPARLVVTPGTLVRDGSTVRPTDGGVRTGQAGGLAELRRAPAAGPLARKILQGSAAQLSGDGGVTVVPGQALVLGLPNAHDDADPARPVLRVAADAAAGAGAVRVVALDLTARALADTTLAAGDVEVPTGTATVVVLGVGVGQAGAAGLAGWAAAGPAVQVAPGAALVPGAALRGPAAPWREAVPDRSARGLAVVRAADVVRGVGVVETVLPAGTRTLLVALDRLSGDTVDGLVLALRGLRRRTGPGGVLPPVPVVQGRRTVLLYPVEADPDALAQAQAAAAAAGRSRPAATAAVSIASDERWEVAAVVGGTEPADRLARNVTASGVEGLLAPLVGGSTGAASVRWIHEGPGEG